MTKKEYRKILKAIKKLLKKRGAVEVEPELKDHYAFAFEIKTKDNKIILSFEKYKKGSKIFSIFGKYAKKPGGEINSKRNFHISKSNNLLDYEIRYYLGNL